MRQARGNAAHRRDMRKRCIKRVAEQIQRIGQWVGGAAQMLATQLHALERRRQRFAELPPLPIAHGIVRHLSVQFARAQR